MHARDRFGGHRHADEESVASEQRRRRDRPPGGGFQRQAREGLNKCGAAGAAPLAASALSRIRRSPVSCLQRQDDRAVAVVGAAEASVGPHRCALAAGDGERLGADLAGNLARDRGAAVGVAGGPSDAPPRPCRDRTRQPRLSPAFGPSTMLWPISAKRGVPTSSSRLMT